jgi:hypothetical protein
MGRAAGVDEPTSVGIALPPGASKGFAPDIATDGDAVADAIADASAASVIGFFNDSDFRSTPLAGSAGVADFVSAGIGSAGPRGVAALARLSQSGRRPAMGWRSPPASESPRGAGDLLGTIAPKSTEREPSVLASCAGVPRAYAAPESVLLTAGAGKNGRARSAADFLASALSPAIVLALELAGTGASALSGSPALSLAEGTCDGASAIPKMSSKEARGAGSFLSRSSSAPAPVAAFLPTGSSAIILRIEAKISSIVGSLAFSAFAISVPTPSPPGAQKRS